MAPKLPLLKLSFRLQVLLLGGLVTVLFLAVLFSGFTALHYTKSSVLNDEKRHLLETTRALAQEYSDKAEFTRRNDGTPPLDKSSSDASNDVLAPVSSSALQNLEGVEGGFYGRRTDSLLGDSFPTRKAEDYPDQDTGGTKRLAILQVAREAVQTRQPSERAIVTPHNIVLIEAVPIRDDNGVSGSAWTVKHLPSLPGTNRLHAYLIMMGLGLAALICVLSTLLIAKNLQSGVTKIEGGLENLEHDLSSQITLGNEPGEITRISLAINRLGSILHEKIESEKQIEDRLRHAERLAALGRLIAGVAHEVRNPLATIRLRVQMCQQSSKDPNVHESCTVALEEIERLNGMVNRLLNFSQPVQLHLEWTNLSLLLEQRLESSEEKAQDHRVRFVRNSNGASRFLLVDQNRMAQVFDNVIQNAIEAMHDSGGTLCTNVTCDEGGSTPGRQEICVEFSDSGSGISPAVKGRAFDPFFTTKPTGTGLGLSICHELVRAHGGQIKLVSGNGHGTTVRILLPVSDPRLAPRGCDHLVKNG